MYVMGKVKILEVPMVDVHGRRVRGHTQKLVQIESVRQPFVKKQTVQIVVTHPRDPKGPLLQQVKKTTEIYYNTTFMEAIQAAQEKHPGCPISIKTLDLIPDWKKEEDALHEALLRGMS